MLVVAGAGSALAAKQPVKCLDDWVKASAIVKNNKMINVDQLGRLARKHIKGRILKTKLCSRGGRYVYRLDVIGQDGRMRRMEVDSIRPFE